jgi:hypothetical protein
MNIRRALAAIALAVTATSSNAALQGVSSWVQSLRIESGVAFISLDQPIPVCGSRVWVDLSTPVGRAIYSTAMLAFTLPKPVDIRAYDESVRNNGACQLFDINVHN